MWTLILIGVLALVYGLQLFNARSAVEPSIEALLAGGGNLGYLTLTSEPWRLLTSMFMHGNWIHLLMNLAFLMAIGPRAEAVFGARRYLILFLAGGVIAGLGSAVWGVAGAARTNLLGQLRYDLVVSVGASGALMALCGGLFIAAMTDHERKSPLLHEPDFLKRLLPAVGLTLAHGFMAGSTDQAAHIVGLVAGAVLGACLFISRHADGRASRGLGLAVGLLLAPALSALLVPQQEAKDLRVISKALAEQERSLTEDDLSDGWSQLPPTAAGAAPGQRQRDAFTLPEHAGAIGAHELRGTVP